MRVGVLQALFGRRGIGIVQRYGLPKLLRQLDRRLQKETHAVP